VKNTIREKSRKNDSFFPREQSGLSFSDNMTHAKNCGVDTPLRLPLHILQNDMQMEGVVLYGIPMEKCISCIFNNRNMERISYLNENLGKIVTTI